MPAFVFRRRLEVLYIHIVKNKNVYTHSYSYLSFYVETDIYIYMHFHLFTYKYSCVNIDIHRNMLIDAYTLKKYNAIFSRDARMCGGRRHQGEQGFTICM